MPSPLPARSISLHTEAAGAAPPDAFGPFRVLHQIGAGALGPVFRAYDSEQAKLVAVKLFRIDLPPERVHQLIAELETLIGADLSHPGIAAPIAAGISGAAAYLAQDFVAADSLDTAVREHGAAPPDAALRVVMQIAGALDSAAAAGIFHGSLHPRDVLISADDARITGLGITQALARVGFVTPVRRPYTAPERSVAGPWDRRADVFSLAALAYELLWGRRISATGREAAAAVTAIRGADLADLQEHLARALAENPADRFATAGEFAAAFEAALTAVSTADTQPPPAPRRPRNLRPAAMPLPLEGSAPDDTVAARPPGPAHGPDEDDTIPDTTLEIDGADDTVPETALQADDVDATVPDVALRAAEEARFADAEAPPSLVEPPKPPTLFTHPARTGAGDSNASTSSLWPIALALFVGIALGFSGGYWLGNVQRDRRAPAAEGEAAPKAVAPVTDVRLPADVPPAETEVQLSPAATADRSPSSTAALKPLENESARGAVAVRTGRITVRSTPPGARVSIDGRDAGKTPITIRNLARGAHIVRVSRDGYRTQERRVNVTAAQPARTLTVQLPRAPARAPAPPPAKPSAKQTSLVVESRPSGATVVIDGKLVGTTPVSIEEVPAGAHAVRLELNGYKPWTASVRVVSGEANRIAASLEQ